MEESNTAIIDKVEGNKVENSPICLTLFELMYALQNHTGAYDTAIRANIAKAKKVELDNIAKEEKIPLEFVEEKALDELDSYCEDQLKSDVRDMYDETEKKHPQLSARAIVEFIIENGTFHCPGMLNVDNNI